jgi:hypothetical protein
MQLCFVSVHGPRETYFVDEPRMYPRKGLGTRKLRRLRRYPTSRKIAGLSPDEVIGFFSIYLNLPDALWPWGLLSL